MNRENDLASFAEANKNWEHRIVSSRDKVVEDIFNRFEDKEEAVSYLLSLWVIKEVYLDAYKIHAYVVYNDGKESGKLNTCK